MLPTTTPIGTDPWDTSGMNRRTTLRCGVPGYYTVTVPVYG